MGDTGWSTPTGGPWRVSRTKYILQPGEEARQRRKFSFHSSTARLQHSQPAPQMLFLPNLQPLGWKQLPLLPLLSTMHAVGPDPHQQNLVLPCDRDTGPKHAVPTLNQAREAQPSQTLSAALPVTCLRMAEQGWAPLGPPRLRWSPSTTQGPPQRLWSTIDSNTDPFPPLVTQRNCSSTHHLFSCLHPSSKGLPKPFPSSPQLLKQY